MFRTEGVRLSSRFRRGLRHCDWTVRADTAFAQVIEACAAHPAPRPARHLDHPGHDARPTAHCIALGHAHSFEVFAGDRLVGGIYGVAVGRMFFGESMFSARDPAAPRSRWRRSPAICRDWGWPLLDAQVENDHLLSLGAERWPRARFPGTPSAS